MRSSSLALIAMAVVAAAGLARASPSDQNGGLTLGDVAPLPPLAGTAPPAGTAPLATTVVSNPDWLYRPSGDDMARYYPPVPQLLALRGHVTIDCVVKATGDVDQCQVVTETPKGMGFGAAAIAMSRDFRMKPMTRDGVAVGGARVVVPIGFASPDDQDGAAQAPPAGPPTTASPAALALATRVVSATSAAKIREAEQKLRDWLNMQFANLALTEQEQAAIDDYVEAAGAALKSNTDAEAARYAGVFTQQQLAALAAFFESSLGQAWINQTYDQPPARQALTEQLWAGVRAAARQKFCEQQGC